MERSGNFPNGTSRLKFQERLEIQQNLNYFILLRGTGGEPRFPACRVHIATEPPPQPISVCLSVCLRALPIVLRSYSQCIAQELLLAVLKSPCGVGNQTPASCTRKPGVLAPLWPVKPTYPNSD